MFRELAEIQSNELISKGHYLIRLHAPRISSTWAVGQFVNVLSSCCDGHPPMLRRPFSIYNSDGEVVEFIYRIVGVGTQVLSGLQAGQKLDVIGPLGKGFELPKDRDGIYVLVCGGVGAPPIIALARLMLECGFDFEFYFGARDSDSLIFHDYIKNMPFKSFFATEDGSVGYNGFISDILPKERGRIACVYACGPMEMLRAVNVWRERLSLKYYASVESKMGCGVGVCLGCSVPSKNGKYLLACHDGPVFNADVIDWSKIR